MTTDVTEKVMAALGAEGSTEPAQRVQHAKIPAKKSGKPTWKPAQQLEVTNKDSEAFSYRWCHNDSANLQRKQAEGWEFVNSETGIPAEHDRQETIADGAALTGKNSYRELILMALPRDLAEARKRYIRDQTNRQTQGVKGSLRSGLDRIATAERGDRAAIHGHVTID